MRCVLIVPCMLLVTAPAGCFRRQDEPPPPPPEGMYAQQPDVPAGSEPGSLALRDFEAVSERTQAPCLLLEGQLIFESTDIVERLAGIGSVL